MSKTGLVGNATEYLDNVVNIERRSREWNGVTIEERHARNNGRVLHELVREKETGLTISLNEVGGFTEPRVKRDQACQIEHRPNHMSLIPKGMRMWGYSEVEYVHYAILRFDIEVLSKKFTDEFVLRAFENPRVRFNEARIVALVRMLLDVDVGDDASQLLGDSLTAGIFAILSAEGGEVREQGGLAPWQVRRAIEYMRDQLPRQIELQELAALVGQSQWHFCRAFKASTGSSPYQWQLDQRVDLAKELLLNAEIGLEHVAEATGFSDAQHLTRAFRRRVGETPSRWRRMRR